MNFMGIELNPHILFWFLLPCLPFAAGLIVYLYVQQRRLAPPKTLLALAAIRILLLIMIAILFLRPVKAWQRTTSSAGTLWLLVDQSPSMQSPDPQSTPVERLHWAEALGYTSPDLRKPRLDVYRANLIALQSAFATLRPADASPLPDKEPARISDFARQLAAWNKQFDAIKSTLDGASALSSPTGASVKDALSHVAALAHDLPHAVKTAPDLAAASAIVNWSQIDENLARAIADLALAGDAADTEFLRLHGADADLAAAGARVTGAPRNDLAFQFLTAPARRGERSLSDVLSRYRIRIATFSDAAQATGAIDPAAFPDVLKAALSPAGTPTGAAQSTNISAGLQAIAEQIAPDEPASIIIVTDGRHNVPGDPTEPARLLASRNGTGSGNQADNGAQGGVRVFGLLVGSHAVSPDAAVDHIDAPEWIYKGDTLKAAVLIRLDGLAGKIAHVELRRGAGATQVVVDSQNVPIDSSQTVKRIDFSDIPPESQSSRGVLDYEVRIAELPGEVNVENNRAAFRVAVKKDKLYALLIDDRPRWEYRYLAAHLGRDPRIKLQSVLFDPALIEKVTPPDPVKASPANSRQEAQILPQTREDWQAFDIIILGDIPPEKISPTQQQYIAAAVRDKGATLITIAGQRNMPAAYSNSPLAELLPVTLAPQFDDDAIARHNRIGFRPSLAPEGNGSVLGQLDMNADTNANYWSNLPLWYWHSPFTQAKPSATVIWSIADASGAGEAGAPVGSLSQSRKSALLATLSIGLGKSLYLAADQSWRLRQVYGSNVHERLWNNILGWAVGSDLPAGGKFVRFGASQPRYAEGQPVEITARILQDNLVPYSGLAFFAIAKAPNSGLRTGGGQNSGLRIEARFQETETPGYYRATLAGLPPGDIEISLQGAEVERLLNTDPSVTQKTLLLKIVPQLNLERRNMNTDPALLARIAQAGNGFSLDANYADILASHLPQIQRTHITTEHIGFFTDPSADGTRYAHLGFLTLFALLLTTEWLLRKRAGLV